MSKIQQHNNTAQLVLEANDVVDSANHDQEIAKPVVCAFLRPYLIHCSVFAVLLLKRQLYRQ